MRKFLEPTKKGESEDGVHKVKKHRAYFGCKGGSRMANLSELDLQNLRHLMGGYDTTHCKMKAYAESAKDPQIKQFFEKGAKSAMENKQTLMKFLQ